MGLKTGVKAFIKLLKKKELLPIKEVIPESKLLENKVALITGGSSGIGYAIAEDFIKHGCKVILIGTNEKKLNCSINTLKEKFKTMYVSGIAYDIRNTESLDSIVEKAASIFDGKIDILVNSAGVLNTNSFEKITSEEYDRIMDVNCKGTFFMCQSVSKYMIKNSIKGHILNISSSAALRPAWTPYQMSKWAIKGFTVGLADMLLPYGIIVNAIAPGPVATPMLNKGENESIYEESFPSKRYGLPEEIAKLATFMASDMGNMIVGDTFYITGGSGTISMHH